jgi:hypothetical protein
LDSPCHILSYGIHLILQIYIVFSINLVKVDDV